MASDLMLRRQWTLKTHGKQFVFVKHAKEQSAHVFMKALLWVLYLPEYPEFSVEIHVGDHFKLDVVALAHDHQPVFWREAGKINPDKIGSLVRRYRHTHLAIAKWNMNITPLVNLLEKAAAQHLRSAPFVLIRFRADSAERSIDEQGHIRVHHKMLEWTIVTPQL